MRVIIDSTITVNFGLYGINMIDEKIMLSKCGHKGGAGDGS